MSNTTNSFFWYELMTSDMAAAEAFYRAVVGWTAEPFAGAGPPYTILKAGEQGAAGLMTIPEEAKAMGARPAWLGYVHTPDVDAAVASLTAAGGRVHRPASDIPGVGRFAVVADPQGAMFMMMSPAGAGQPPLDPMAPGNIGWRELMTTDWRAAFDFYAAQFGWTKDQSIDMGPMGIYQLFAVAGAQNGGMMNKPPEIPHPYWQFYFNVDGADAVAERIRAHGGTVIMEPMEVPGGAWVVNAMDQQGAVFGAVAPKK